MSGAENSCNLEEGDAEVSELAGQKLTQSRNQRLANFIQSQPAAKPTALAPSGEGDVKAPYSPTEGMSDLQRMAYDSTVNPETLRKTADILLYGSAALLGGAAAGMAFGGAAVATGATGGAAATGAAGGVAATGATNGVVTTLVSAAVGAGGNGVSSVAADAILQEPIDWGKAGESAMIGGIVGGVAGLVQVGFAVMPPAVRMVPDAMFGMLGNLTVGGSGSVGALAGALGSASKLPVVAGVALQTASEVSQAD